MNHPQVPLQDEERADLLVACTSHPERIPAIREKYRRYRDLEFPDWYGQYCRDFDAWLKNYDHKCTE